MCSSKLLPNSPQKTGTVSELRILLAQPLKACEGVVLARIRLQFTCISCNTQRVLSKTGEASREHQRLPEGSGHNHSVSGEAKRAAPCPQSCGTRDRWVLIAHYMALPLSPLNLAQYQKASRCWKNLSTSLFPYFRGCYLHKQKQQANNRFLVPWLEFHFLEKYKNKNHVS